MLPCCRVGSPQLACGESGVSSDAGGRTWKASRELRGGAKSSGKIRRAASEAVDVMPEAARRAPGGQRCRREATRISFQLVCEVHRCTCCSLPDGDGARRAEWAPTRASAASGIQRGALQLLEASERAHSAEQARGSLLSCAFRSPRVQGRLFCASKTDAAHARTGRGGCCPLHSGARVPWIW